jgi:hypothetical protein
MILLWLACAGPSGPLRGGDYELRTVAMQDDCLDGALEALFMPGGPDTPQVFEFPVSIPDVDALPAQISVDLREPFVGMPVDVSADDDGVLRGTGSMTDVLLDQALYGDCTAQMDVTVEIVPESTTAATGHAELELSDVQGEDQGCPAMTDGCAVWLDLRARRL